MIIAIAIVLFLLILAAVGAFGYHFYVKPSRMLDQLTYSNDRYPEAAADKDASGSGLILPNF